MSFSIDNIIDIVTDETVKLELKETFANIEKIAPEIAELMADKLRYLSLWDEKKVINKEQWVEGLNDLLGQIELKLQLKGNLSNDAKTKELSFRLIDTLSTLKIEGLELQGPHGSGGGVED